MNIGVHLLMAVLGVWLAHIVYHKEYRHWFKKPPHPKTIVLKPETWGRNMLTERGYTPKIKLTEQRMVDSCAKTMKNEIDDAILKSLTEKGE